MKNQNINTPDLQNKPCTFPDDDSQITVFPVLEQEEELDSFMGEVSSNEIIYLKIEEQDEESPQSDPEPESSDTLSYVVQATSVLDASSVLNSGIKIVTLGDEQYFYIPPSTGKHLGLPNLLFFNFYSYRLCNMRQYIFIASIDQNQTYQPPPDHLIFRQTWRVFRGGASVYCH